MEASCWRSLSSSIKNAEKENTNVKWIPVKVWQNYLKMGPINCPRNLGEVVSGNLLELNEITVK